MCDCAGRVAVLEAQIANLQARMANMITRGTLESVTDDTGQQKLVVRGLYGEKLEGVPRWEQFGQTGHPPAGSDVLMDCIGGSRDMAQIIAAQPPGNRPKNTAEGAQMLTSLNGQSSVLIDNGAITIKAGSITLEAGSITLKGPTAVEGASLTHNGVNVGDDHTHSGIVPGPADTGPPN